MLFLPAPAELLSWNQKPWLSRHAHAFGSVQQVRTRLSERVSQEHLQLQLQCPAFTCCERLSKLPTGCFLQDRSSCQFEELFRKHKLVFTGPVWIAGHVAPLNRCRIASSSRLQMAMQNRPAYLPRIYRQWFQTIQSQVVSWDDFSAHGSRLCLSHVRSTRSSWPNWELFWNDQQIDRSVHVWLCSKAMLFLPAPAKLLSWNQKP